MITLPSEIATSAGMFVFAIVQALILLALAPLFSGICALIFLIQTYSSAVCYI